MIPASIGKKIIIPVACVLAASLFILQQMTYSQKSKPEEEFHTAQEGQEEEQKGHGSHAPLPSQEEIAQLPKDGGEEFNRLIFEQSPYLLQHTRNPVDWYPWGEEAFKKAKEEDKPVFLSIGYSTCHWCHVMERESFETEKVAALMNQYFISVKVDREERPDLDQVYMDVTRALTGGGGWPMTVILTPEKKPFYAGTYFPRESRFGRPGMLDLVPQIGEAWKNRRNEILDSAQKITEHVKNMGAVSSAEIGPEILDQAYSELASRFDSVHGGFRGQPKFPTPHNYRFLLRYWHTSDEPKALDITVKTLKEMRKGGIFDQIGYGFHRYSTDAEWLLPHFEKMLYDQALISMLYLEAYQATKDPEFSATAEEIFTYVLRDMTSDTGGFYSAEDADSEGEEGKFYVWSTEEIRSILPKDDADLFIEMFNLDEDGNFREEATGEKIGANIPHLTKWYDEWAEEKGTTTEELRDTVNQIRQTLFTGREKRIHPLKDDKILTDWNGLMIAALAMGGRVLEKDEYTQSAKKAADFVLKELRTDEGRLHKRYRNGEAGLSAHLEDYAFLVWGLLELYETTFDTTYLTNAIELNEMMIQLFEDEERGGFYLTADDSEELLMRPKDLYDGAIPSGNSVAVLNLLRLSRLTGNMEYEQIADKTVNAFSGNIARQPSAYSQLLLGLSFAFGPSYEVVVSGDPNQPDTKTMLRELNTRFLPNKVILLRPNTVETPPITQIAEYTKPQTSIDGKATVYVCQNFACKVPTTDVKEMLSFLQVSAN